MNIQLLITAVLMVSPLLIVLSPILLLAGINLIYLIFNRKDEVNQGLSIISISSLYLFAFVPLGILIGGYLSMRKKSFGEEKQYKFSSAIRSNGGLIMIISIASTIFSILNLQ